MKIFGFAILYFGLAFCLDERLAPKRNRLRYQDRSNLAAPPCHTGDRGALRMGRPLALARAAAAALSAVLLSQAFAQDAGAPAPLAFTVAPSAADWQLTQRDFHSQVWEAIIPVRNLVTGREVPTRRSFVEIGTCINYLDDFNQWQRSREEFIISQDGRFAIAQFGPLKLIVENNLNSATVLDCLTLDGVRLRNGPIAIGYFDPVDGRNAILATVRDTVGALTAANEVTFASAFEGLNASIRVTYRKAGISVDLILHEAPPDPEQLQLSSYSRLELYTEFTPDSPAPMQIERVLRRESNEQLRQAMVNPDFVDHLLDYGQYKMGSGTAFEWNGAPGAARLPVAKRYEIVAGSRPILTEAIEYAEAKKLFAGLRPAKNNIAKASPSARTPGAQSPSSAANTPTAKLADKAVRAPRVATFQLPLRPASTFNPKPIQKAQATFPAQKDSPKFVLDYSLLTGASNVTLSANTTFFVSSDTYLYGKTVIQDAVIKYTNNAVTAAIRLKGEVDCQTSATRPLVCTSQSDNTIGETLPWSTGNPNTNFCANPAIELDYYTSGLLGTLRHLRVAHAKAALSFYLGHGHVVEHAQIIRCDEAVQPSSATVSCRNFLVDRANIVFKGTSTATCRVEHLTVDCASLLLTNTTVFLTNSLLVAVTNTGSYSGSNNALDSDPANVFFSVGAGSHYLLNNTYRNLGTTNVAILADIRQRTTFPPLVLSNALTINSTLTPQAMRDTDMPDLGYEYFPIDWAVKNLNVSNATLTVTNGAVIATFGNAGVWLNNGGQLISEGSPVSPNFFLRYCSIQEQSTNWGDGTLPNSNTILPFWLGTPAPSIRLRFSTFSLPGSSGYHLYAASETGWGITNLQVRDCQFSGSAIYLWENTLGKYSFTNNLCESLELELFDAATLELRNNLFKGVFGFLSQIHSNGAWNFKDNLVDSSTLVNASSWMAHNYNAYFQSSDFYSTYPTNSTEMVLTNLTYHTGYLSRYYQPTNSPLVDAGSFTNASLAGFYQYTSFTNNVKEATNRLDIGIHWIALNSQLSTPTPNDSESDTLGDWFEDWNGNGVYDSSAGETDWQTYTSIYGIGPGPGLVVFTPLK